MRPTFFAYLLVTVLAAPVAPAAGETYAVRVFRPSHPGDVEDMDATATWHARVVRTVAGEPPTVRDQDGSVHLVGRCTVLATDDRGVVTKLRCEVAKAVTAVGGRTAQLLPMGTVVEVTNPAGTVEYKRPDGEPVAPVAAALRYVLTLRAPGAPVLDELFPTGGPRAIGDSWPLDVAKMAEYDRAAHISAARQVSGRATLVKLTKAGGEPCLVVEQTVDVSGGAATTRPGLTQSLDHGTTTYTDTLPLNPAAHGGTADQATANDYVGRGATPDGKPFDERNHYTIEKHWTMTPVAP